MSLGRRRQRVFPGAQHAGDLGPDFRVTLRVRQPGQGGQDHQHVLRAVAEVGHVHQPPHAMVLFQDREHEKEPQVQVTHHESSEN